MSGNLRQYDGSLSDVLAAGNTADNTIVLTDGTRLAGLSNAAIGLNNNNTYIAVLSTSGSSVVFNLDDNDNSTFMHFNTIGGISFSQNLWLRDRSDVISIGPDDRTLYRDDGGALTWNTSNSGVIAVQGDIPVLATKVYSGNYDTTGVALQTVYHIVHGVGGTPSFAWVTPKVAGSAALYYLTYNATDIIIHFLAAPGAVDVNFDWGAIR